MLHDILEQLAHTWHLAGEHVEVALVEEFDGLSVFRETACKFGSKLGSAFAGVYTAAPLVVHHMPQEPPCLGLIAEVFGVDQLGAPLHQHVAEVEDYVSHKKEVCVILNVKITHTSLFYCTYRSLKFIGMQYCTFTGLPS